MIYQSKIIPINLDIVKAKDKLTQLQGSLLDTSKTEEEIAEQYELLTQAEAEGNDRFVLELKDRN